MSATVALVAESFLSRAPSCCSNSSIRPVSRLRSVGKIINMGVKHLKKGDPQLPAVEPGKLRLYSMTYCAFAHRVRLVLHAKRIPYEEVNINIKNKPEWYSSVVPSAKVPALDDGGKILVESLDIADYLETKFPDHWLWPSDPEVKARHKKLIEDFGKVVDHFYSFWYQKPAPPFPKVLQEIVPLLKPLEKELAKNGSTFFAGSRPGMLDYMIWPWAERVKTLNVFGNLDGNFPKEQFPKLISWRKAMAGDPAVQAVAHTNEQHERVVRGALTGTLNADDLD